MSGIMTELDTIAKDLSRTLIQRFWTSEAYYLHDDVVPILRHLSDRRKSFTSLNILPPAIVSGSDEGALKVLVNLNIVRPENGSQGEGGTPASDWQIDARDVYTTWAVEADKRDVAFWEHMLIKLNENGRCGGRPLMAHEILVVGDEYAA